MSKLIAPYFPFSLGDVRIIKHELCAYTQEYGPGGWENFQMLPHKQTLTGCIDELYRCGFAYIGRESSGGSVFYYRQAGTACA